MESGNGIVTQKEAKMVAVNNLGSFRVWTSLLTFLPLPLVPDTCKNSLGFQNFFIINSTSYGTISLIIQVDLLCTLFLGHCYLHLKHFGFLMIPLWAQFFLKYLLCMTCPQFCCFSTFPLIISL